MEQIVFLGKIEPFQNRPPRFQPSGQVDQMIYAVGQIPGDILGLIPVTIC
ncbi:hypothetical protein [Paracoccus sp. J56]|nr:hypothetical protein [Paracoccus sp. J56]